MPKSNNDSELLNRLRQIRTAHNLTQQDLAEQVNVSRQTIIAIEKSQYNPSTVLALKIAQTFQLSIEDIFWLNEESQ